MTTTLYRLFDTSDRLLYVGVSLRGLNRLKQHRDGKPWGASIARMTLENFDDRPSALIAEAAAIKRECPMYNVLGQEARVTPGTLSGIPEATMRALAARPLAGSEFRIVLAILADQYRRGSSYRRWQRIKVAEFMGLGLPRSSIFRSIAHLEAQGIIRRRRSGGPGISGAYEIVTDEAAWTDDDDSALAGQPPGNT